ncbi:hypothetical protein AB1Y20_017930 [Prymnesium parvum]|uniref:Uncharacterized protein n=1 Tax=Prymnesium parvum TaxID=97485 RepID=A0AB34JM08_PRYPA
MRVPLVWAACVASVLAQQTGESSQLFFDLEASVELTAQHQSSAPAVLCSNTCKYSYDRRSTGTAVCDDGGEGHASSECELGTDCDDCGPRQPVSSHEDHRQLQASPSPGPAVCTCCAAVFWSGGGNFCQHVSLWELSAWTCHDCRPNTITSSMLCGKATFNFRQMLTDAGVPNPAREFDLRVGGGIIAGRYKDPLYAALKADIANAAGVELVDVELSAQEDDGGTLLLFVINVEDGSRSRTIASSISSQLSSSDTASSYLGLSIDLMPVVTTVGNAAPVEPPSAPSPEEKPRNEEGGGPLMVILIIAVLGGLGICAWRNGTRSRKVQGNVTYGREVTCDGYNLDCNDAAPRVPAFEVTKL